MSKILVGRDKKNEVEIGNSLVRAAKTESKDAKKEEELVEAAVENEQVVVVEEGNVPEAEAAHVKGRGKKRGKA